MEEGSILSTEEGLDLMAKILLYKITHWGVAEFTPSSNPALNTAYVGNDSLNFTENDWNALFHPLQHSSIYLDMEKALNIIDNVLGNYDPITEVPDYLYWVSSNEKKRADNNAGMEITFETNTAAYYRTYDIDGDGQSYLLFLSNKSDFDKIIDFAN